MKAFVLLAELDYPRLWIDQNFGAKRDRHNWIRVANVKVEYHRILRVVAP